MAMEPNTLIDWNNYTLGETDELIQLEYHQESIDATLRLAQQAQNTLSILSLNLDSTIFNTNRFIDAARELAIKNKFSSIRILVSEPDHIIKDGHRLLDLSRRLSSSISIKEISNEFKSHRETFVVADDRGYLFRTNSERYEGVANFYNPLQSKVYLDDFNEIWTHSKSITDFKRLYL